jgi:hypothetical protein
MERNPWNRLDAETDKAFAAFEEYRKLGPHQRSLQAVTQQLYPSGTTKGDKRRSIPGCVWRWYKQHEWEDRARAWDADRLAKDLEATETTRRQTLISAWDGLSGALRIQNERLVTLAPDSMTRWANSLRDTIQYLEHGDDPNALTELVSLLQSEGWTVSPPVAEGTEEEPTSLEKGETPEPNEGSDESH